MRNHSGHDESSNNNLDPTLKEREGQGGPGGLPKDDDFSVAADHDQTEGKRTPSAGGRGEVDVSGCGRR